MLVLARSVVAVASLVSLAACQESTPQPSSGPTGAPTVAESRAVAVPGPDTEPEPEQESPEQFIRRYMAVSDQAQVSGNFVEYKKVVTSDCESCANYMRLVKKVYASGGSVQFDGTQILRFVDSPEGGTWFDFDFRVGDAIVVDEHGREVNRYPAGESRTAVHLQRSGKSWKVHAYGTRGEL